MMDGRFDQQFAELFAATLDDKDAKDTRHLLWPLGVACLVSLGVLVFAVLGA